MRGPVKAEATSSTVAGPSKAGERVADQIEIELPTGLAPGTYALNVGMYTLADLQRATLTLPDGSPAPDNSLRLAEVEVR